MSPETVPVKKTASFVHDAVSNEEIVVVDYSTALNAAKAYTDCNCRVVPIRDKPTTGLCVAVPSRNQAILPWRPFPVEALPEPFCSFVDVGAKAIGCDPSYIVLPGLAVLASAIGTTRRIRLKSDWHEYPIVWAVPVGESGTLKSPAQDVVLEPIYQQQCEALKQEKRIVCGDTTVEALAVLLESNPRGLLLARDELSGWLGSFDRYNKGNGDVSHWLAMNGGRPLFVDRKTGEKKTIYVPHAAVSITGPIQPATLTRALGRQHFENGLAARLLLAMPPRNRKRWTDEEIPAKVKAAFANTIERLLGLEHSANRSGDPIPIDAPLTKRGRIAWVRFYDDFAAEQSEITDPDRAAAFSKLEAYAARFALIFHFVRWAAGDSTLTNPDAIDEQSINAGVKVVEWFCYETRRIYQVFREDAQMTEQRRLIEWIQQRGGSVTVREVQQHFRRFATADEARAALAALVLDGVGKWVPPHPQPKGGRPTERLELVYGVYVYETPTGVTESRGSVDADNGASLQGCGNG